MTIFELVRDIYKIDAKNVTSTMFFLPIQTIFKLNRRVQETNVLTKFHEDLTKNVTSRVQNCPAPGGHVFSSIWTIFKLVRDINKTNAKIVTFRVFTRNTAPPPGGHTNILTNFELGRGIIGTNVLKFHEDQTINVASRVFTRQMLTTDALHTTDKKAITKAHHEHVVLR
ncbi:hypothetical protein DPMN_034765 [Dreissena polymorpha]|uniref:Uncharacterized protein n=1 Tax=Dreissena polymorpha TaxID=45954 RepID=A0A9D4RMD1_DREPO|nr:hypothetical protein DPMN_034765 [Dreissena polymorpha]